MACPYARVIPHSDGAGVIDQVGDGVSQDVIGRRVWCHGAQSYRPFGTAAEFTVVPRAQAVPLPDHVSFDQGACLGIPGITAHRCVHAAGDVKGRTVVVQGGAGAVGICAVQLAQRAGARVIAIVRSAPDASVARAAGAQYVIVHGPGLTAQVRAVAPAGVDHVVDVAFGANIATDVERLAMGGSVAAYASDVGRPAIPFWLLLFENIRIDLLGSDDFTAAQKTDAIRAVSDALEAGWEGMPIAERLSLGDIAIAHERLETARPRGRVIVSP